MVCGGVFCVVALLGRAGGRLCALTLCGRSSVRPLRFLCRKPHSVSLKHNSENTRFVSEPTELCAKRARHTAAVHTEAQRASTCRADAHTLAHSAAASAAGAAAAPPPSSFFTLRCSCDFLRAAVFLWTMLRFTFLSMMANALDRVGIAAA